MIALKLCSLDKNICLLYILETIYMYICLLYILETIYMYISNQ